MLTKHPKPLISVIVCTYNRDQLLDKCLKSLVNQTASQRSYQVLVVDNNSTDDTACLIHQYINRCPNFFLATESRIGLSRARNCGWKKAQGKYIAYIDDDAIAAPDWITQIKKFILKHPDIQVFGGPYSRYAQVPIAPWLPPKYGIYSLGNKERPVKIGHEWLNGTNMIFSKNIFLKFGGFNPHLGMQGKHLSYGEETNFFIYLYKKGITIYYSPHIKVKHLVADYKMGLLWQLKNKYFIGHSWSHAHDKKVSFHVRAYCLLRSIKFCLQRLFKSEPMPIKRKLYLAFSNVFQELGSTSKVIEVNLKSKLS